MRDVKEFLNSKKFSMIYLLVFAFITGGAIIGQAYLLVSIIDGVFLDDLTFREILPLLGGLFIILFVRTMFTYLSGRVGVRLGANAKRYFRYILLANYTENPVQASLKGQAGQKVSVTMDATDEIDSYFSQYIPQVIRSSIIPVMILIVVFTQHVNTGLIMLITFPFIPLFMVIIGMQTKKKSEEQMEKLAVFSGRFLDTLQGLVTLKLFGKAKQQKEAIQQSSLGFRDATMDILKVAFASSFMLELISMLAIGIIALEVALQLIIFDGISFFTAFYVLVLAPEFFTALRELGTAFHNGRSSMGAIRKIEEELVDGPAVHWGDKPIPKTDIPVKLELINAGFQYGEDQFALRQINTSFSPITKNAIVGKTGSGKTTLLHMIAGIIPTHGGGIAIDGVPLTKYKEEDWFHRLSYISQDPYIFSGTITDNIAIGSNHQQPTKQEIEEAAEQAGISDTIASFEHGYDTVVGEGGRGLSGGEKQRLALARAFLKQPSIVLFDEPTVGLDLKTERILQSSIEKLARTATIITVAHRLHTIKDADKILFLDDGMLIAEGTHEQLVQTVPGYRTMVSVQRGGKAE
ncbi:MULTISPECIES: thiol reductant ABC exporter subunit CydD [Virgibacillus]|uniref:Thiol reductant ABC exporter subunit CydD n=1 Tax=Virgibacillus salarius TaxID=447199 RepID=A0A941DVX9_9BACI|nr:MULTISPECIES: thiol reductant ABC exporter subunit CydD [Bacillaceae]MBR7796477.1 thiol reductant ABC exporter subunit CydD [Virgibacillus salarius]NAZ09186.1 thiol reductant ABC exporter subunit CydD [Agaribacter marinus]WBX80941.1 thiol reductant ABC exporter subunit CydD [Virgibacillus salarius]